MRMLMRILPFVVVPGIIACEPAEPAQEMAEPAAGMTTADATAVRAELEGRLEAYERAALAGEIPGMLALWTDDAQLLEPGMNMTGSDLPGFYEELFTSGGATVSAIDIRTSEVFVHGDVAYSIGDYDETVSMGPDAEPMTIHNNYFARWERGADGAWKIDRLVVGAVDAPESMELPQR